MYLPDSTPQEDTQTLELLSSAQTAPSEVCEEDPEVKAAFEKGLRELAEDILEYHPSLAHVLLGMGNTPCPVVHGRN